MSFKLGKIIQIGILSVFTISTSFLLQRDITLSREVITQKQSSLLVPVIVEGGRRIYRALGSAFSEHQRVAPVDRTTFVIPAGDFGGTRISVNFDHKSWVPRGSEPVRVRFKVKNVSSAIQTHLRVVMKADKGGGKKDRDRSGLLQHGSIFELKYGTSGDRAYYFVERDSPFTGRNLSPDAYFKLELLD